MCGWNKFDICWIGDVVLNDVVGILKFELVVVCIVLMKVCIDDIGYGV